MINWADNWWPPDDNSRAPVIIWRAAVSNWWTPDDNSSRPSICRAWSLQWFSQCLLMSLTFDSTHDIYLGFSRSNFEIAVSEEPPVGLKLKGYESAWLIQPLVSPHDFYLGFSISDFEIAVSQEWLVRLTGTKSIRIDKILDPLYNIDPLFSS